MNRFKWIAAALAAALFLYLGWQNVRAVRGVSAEGGEAPTVMTMPVSRGTLIDQVTAPAALDAADRTDIHAAFASDRVTLRVQAGATVRKGDVLAELDTSDLAAEIVEKEQAVRQAEEALAAALRDAQLKPLEAQLALRQAERRVVEAEAALETARREAEAAVEKAKADLAAAEARLAAGAAGPELVAARAAAEAALQALAANPADPELNRAYQEARARYEELEAKFAAEAAAARQAVLEARAALARAEMERDSRILQAEVALEQAKIDLQKLRLQQSAGGGADPVAAAERALKAAREALDTLLRKREEAVIRSPLDGVVLSVDVTDGQAVNTGTKLMTVGRLDQMLVQLQVDEADVTKLKEGMPITLRAQAFPDTFQGTITHVPLQAGSGNQGPYFGPGGPSTFVVKGIIQNPEQKLRIGMNAQAEIITTHREGVVLIGLEALRQDGGPHVFVLEGDVARRRDVVTGATNKTQIEIVEGLRDGDILIIGPFPVLKELRDGQKVKADLPPGMEPGPGPGRGPGGQGDGGGAGGTAPAPAVPAGKG